MRGSKAYMIVITYQSTAVLKILHRNEIYRAKPSIAFSGEYGALIDLLGLKCACPVFGVVKGRKQNTGGKVSGSVRLTLDVPYKHVKLTEYSVWADFLYAYKFTKPGNYKALRPDTEEVSDRRYKEILEDLKKQRKIVSYQYPQVILEKINPKWLVGYKMMLGSGPGQSFGEKFRNLFRK